MFGSAAPPDIKQSLPQANLVAAVGVANQEGADAAVTAVGTVDIFVNNLGIFGS